MHAGQQWTPHIAHRGAKDDFFKGKAAAAHRASKDRRFRNA